MTAEEMKKIQEKLGLTNAALAAKLGVNVSTVERWRAGIRKISPVSATALRLLLKLKGGK